jgi:hypothetical protein
MNIDGMGSTEIIDRGAEFTLENKRLTYTVTTEVTTSGNAATIIFHPGLEDAVVDNDDITFVKNTLRPQDEEIFANLIVSTAAMSDSRSFMNTVNVGGVGTWEQFQSWGERKKAEVLRKLSGSKPRTKRLYTRD